MAFHRAWRNKIFVCTLAPFHRAWRKLENPTLLLFTQGWEKRRPTSTMCLMIFRWYFDDIAMIVRWDFDNISMRFPWYVDDISIICQWYFDDPFLHVHGFCWHKKCARPNNIYFNNILTICLCTYTYLNNMPILHRVGQRRSARTKLSNNDLMLWRILSKIRPVKHI